MQIPLSLPGASATLTAVSQGDRLPPLVSIDPQRRQCTISASDVVLHLRVRAPGDLAKAARLLGPSPALVGQSLSLHLLLVLLERGAAIDGGTAMLAEILAAQANLEESIPDEQSAPPASPAEIRVAARHAIEQGMLALEGRWNIARGLIGDGRAALEAARRGRPCRCPHRRLPRSRRDVADRHRSPGRAARRTHVAAPAQ